jgi:hypothetical protein
MKKLVLLAGVVILLAAAFGALTHQAAPLDDGKAIASTGERVPACEEGGPCP